MAAGVAPRKLAMLHREIVACRKCPRLVAHREQVARVKRRAYRDEEYWGRPVPGFGDANAWLLIVGLAPGAHGANRTGRVFTGDRSGDFLYAALHRAGLASQATSTSREDELELAGAFVTLPVRCVPPGNMPAPRERERCAPFLVRELGLLPKRRVILALGAIAWAAVHKALGEPRAPRFAHGAVSDVAGEAIVASYHVSQQNTQTGRLTPKAFDAILASAEKLSTQSWPRKKRAEKGSR